MEQGAGGPATKQNGGIYEAYA
ncbi:uncharacterized protein G2W53_044103 [Senna tora]|uniref:Uncharacterized protein n=1 Tax=Senna tora TaxID=362788 RepID=A0A834SPZ6_9FABA|nr:uncharacterized protein G2W53_044103 [Senna tora]